MLAEKLLSESKRDKKNFIYMATFPSSQVCFGFDLQSWSKYSGTLQCLSTGPTCYK